MGHLALLMQYAEHMGLQGLVLYRKESSVEMYSCSQQEVKFGSSQVPVLFRQHQSEEPAEKTRTFPIHLVDVLQLATAAVSVSVC